MSHSNVKHRFWTGLLVIGALLSHVSSAAEAAKAPAVSMSKPNIIIVITDDQGYGDLASQGNPHIKTPNLDKLHDEAVRFTNFHVSTTCAPQPGAFQGQIRPNP